MEIEKLKVAELRAELTKLGLDSKGTKAVLVARLKEAVQSQEALKEGEEKSVEKEEEEEEKKEKKETQVSSSDSKEESSNEPKAPETSTVEEEEEEEDEEEEEEEEEEEKEKEGVVEGASAPADSGDAPPKEAENGNVETNEKNEDETKKKENQEEMEVEETVPEEKVKEEEEKKETTKSKQQRRGQKRKLVNEDEPFVVTEDEPDLPKSALLLDWYNSDLNLKIDKESFLVGEPFFKDGWGYVWAGAKATYGVLNGKVAFQVRLLENMDTKLQEEKNLHELRLGFSTDEPSMQLGESLNSFAFCGSGKKATNLNFEEYGETFVKDDVVGAYLDISSEEVKIYFTKNDKNLGEAFSFPKSRLEGKALFPHISTRNVKFEVNFGKYKDETLQEPWLPLLEGYQLIGTVPDGVAGPARISTRGECEMIMMIGLPASGKSTWVSEHVSKNPEKRYNVIGTASLIDKMKIDGVCRKTSHTGRRDLLIQKCTRCLQDWLRLVSQRRRNVVIDQTNVYPNAQKRKVRPFEGMIRKAVVMVPSDEEYKARAEAQEKAENKDVPDSAVMEMKANFALPVEAGVKTTVKNGDGEEEIKESVSPFVEIIFAELNREEAQKLIDEYNKDAKEKGYGKKIENRPKRARVNNFRRGRVMMRGRGRGFPPRSFRGMVRMGRGVFNGMAPPRRGGPPRPLPPPPHMRGFMPRGGHVQHNRNNRNQQKFGKGNRNNWGPDSSPWSQWQQPSRPVCWGPWNQPAPQNQHGLSNQNRSNSQGFSSGGNNVWGQNTGNNSNWSHYPSNNSGGNWASSSNNWNGSSGSWGNNAGGNSSGYNQGYPGNSNWGGGGYGGR